jgi:hypothetical protein
MAATPSTLAAGAEVAREASLDRGGIEPPEDPRKGIVARHSARQAREAAQQRLLAVAEQSHVDAALGAAQRRHQRDHHDLIELLALRIAAARTGKLGETRPKTIHAVLPCNGTARSKAAFYTTGIYKLLVRFPWTALPSRLSWRQTGFLVGDGRR